MDDPPPTLRTAFADDVRRHYADRNKAAVQRLYAKAVSNEERLLCRYRLYTMTRDEVYLDDIPEPVTGTARERALIAGLWAFKTAIAPPWRVPSYGKRSDRMLREARHLDADDPYVLIVQGQGQLYRPSLLGGDPEAALATFRRLRDGLARTGDVDGLSLWEADTWVWMAWHTVAPESAAAERTRLLAADPPPFFRQMLADPP